MVTQVITDLPTNPQRATDPTNFIVNADAWIASLTLWTTEVNLLGLELDTFFTTAEAASTSADAAVAAANFEGNWTDQTGAATIPFAVSHNGADWLLLNNLADVTTSEPGVSADWVEVGASSQTLGDVVISGDNTAYASPTWLKADGSSYDGVAFADLFALLGAVLGQLPNPATLPTGQTEDVAWSSDGTYLAISHQVTPFITIYKRSGDVFTKLTNPGTLPTGAGKDITFSSDDTYLAIGHSVSPFVTIYKRSGDVFTKLANPATLPGNTGIGIDFSPDTNYLAVGSDFGTPSLITIYSRSGDVFTKLSDPAFNPPVTVNGITWDSTSTYMALACSGTPFIVVYKRAGDVFTKLADPSTLPTIGSAIAFNNADDKITIGTATTPFITNYNFAADVLTAIASPAVLPTAQVGSVDYTSDDSRLRCGMVIATPSVLTYSIVGDVYSGTTDPAIDANGGRTFGLEHSPDDTYLAIGDNSSPFVKIYKEGPTLPDLSGVDTNASVDGYINTGVDP